MSEYAVIYELTLSEWSAYAPDLPGLGVAGRSFKATEELIQEGISFQVKGLLADSESVPKLNIDVARMPISA